MAAIAYAYPLAEAGAAAAEAAALRLFGFLCTLPLLATAAVRGTHHPDKPDAHAQPHSTRRDITDDESSDDDEPDHVPEVVYRYNGQHVSRNNEVGHLQREKRFISHTFQQWAHQVYGQRYKFLTGVALAVARRRYRKWRLHGPYAQHTPLLRQIREEIDPFGSPRKKRPRKYTRSQLYAL